MFILSCVQMVLVAMQATKQTKKKIKHIVEMLFTARVLLVSSLILTGSS